MTVVAEVMTTDVRTLGPADTVDVARQLFFLHRIGSVPIVDEHDGLMGIVTSTDVAEDWEPDQLLRTVMQDEVDTVAAAVPVETAARIMRERHIHHLVVTDGADGDAMVGIVSSWDLLDALADIVVEARATTVPVHTVQAGDVLVVREPASAPGRSGEIIEVHGAHGLPPYLVSWADDPDAPPAEVSVVHRGAPPLDGCER